MIGILKKLIDGSKNTVFFGGAGVSTASNIPDFRSTDGLYNMKYKYSPEVILSRSFFNKNLKEFYRFYFDKMIYKEALPNYCHKGLALMEKQGKLKGVITQNIDGLHQLAGSKNVIELHGSVHRNYCIKCGDFYDLDSLLHKGDIPLCKCGGIIKPDVVLYEENLNENNILKAIDLIKNCELLIIGGTSLKVYPASGFIDYFKGKNLVIINKETTVYDNRANYLFNENIDDIFNQLFF